LRVGLSCDQTKKEKIKEPPDDVSFQHYKTITLKKRGRFGTIKNKKKKGNSNNTGLLAQGLCQKGKSEEKLSI
jgi:hypothetical protein